MIKIGNTTPITNNDQLRPITQPTTKTVPTQPTTDATHKPFVERRKGDRRRDRKDDPLLDSRSGKDRRRRPSIDTKA
jgi:hypothetical protein